MSTQLTSFHTAQVPLSQTQDFHVNTAHLGPHAGKEQGQQLGRGAAEAERQRQLAAPRHQLQCKGEREVDRRAHGLVGLVKPQPAGQCGLLTRKGLRGKEAGLLETGTGPRGVAQHTSQACCMQRSTGGAAHCVGAAAAGEGPQARAQHTLLHSLRQPHSGAEQAELHSGQSRQRCRKARRVG